MTDEQRLWQAVITQSLIDLTRATTQKQKDDVIYWVGSMDFVMVCNYANLDPIAIEAVFWKIIDEPDLEKQREIVNNIVYEKHRITKRSKETIQGLV